MVVITRLLHCMVCKMQILLKSDNSSNTYLESTYFKFQHSSIFGYFLSFLPPSFIVCKYYAFLPDAFSKMLWSPVRYRSTQPYLTFYHLRCQSLHPLESTWAREASWSEARKTICHRHIWSSDSESSSSWETTVLRTTRMNGGWGP